MKTRTVRADTPFKCAFCGLEAYISYDDDGPNGVIHAQSMCKTFEENDPTEFLHKYNQRSHR